MAEVRLPLNQNIETLGIQIRYIQTFLQWLVVESGRIKDPNLQQQFSEGLREVLVRLDTAATELLSIESTEDPKYQQLVEVGLTDQQLGTKVAVGRSVAQSAVNPILHPLKWINAILGSLKKVFPQLELVQEYKDHLELALELFHEDPTGPPPPLFTLQA